VVFADGSAFAELGTGEGDGNTLFNVASTPKR